MRSFRLLSLLSSVFLLSLSFSQAQVFNRHEKPGVQYRHHHKRGADAVFTYFADGRGACGTTNKDDDFIVALDSAEYDGGAHCFEMVTITINGKTAQAQITDECADCQVGQLDLSQGLFEYFAQTSEGEVHGSWFYNSDAPTSSSAPLPSTTSDTPAWSSTTTAVTTTFAPAVASMTSSATTVVSSPTLIATIVPSSVPQVPQVPQVIAQINLTLLELGTLLQVSAAF